jgi:Na+/H+ antiporter NhaD/arsenite permease-like protein
VTVARSLALAIFLMTYLGLALGRVPGLRIDRTGIAIVGAAAAVVTGAIPWDREAARGARIEIGFVEYARLGVPITVVTLLVGWALVR